MGLFDADGWLEVAEVARRNKLRTGLTAAGVFWGMFILIVMLGFGDGLETGVTGRMGGSATNAVFIWGQTTTKAHRGRRSGRSIVFRNGDIPAVQDIPGVHHVAPRNQLGGYRDAANVVRRGKTGSYAVMGDVPALRHIQPMNVERGRFLNELDIRDERKVVVLGRTVVEELFEPGEQPIGQAIRVFGVSFVVVGVVASSRGDDRGDREDSTVHLPLSTFQKAFNYGDRIGWFAITGYPEVPASTIEEQTRRVLAERHDVAVGDNIAFGSFNAQREFSMLFNLFFAIDAFVWFVGAMTLLAGVVGVSNIMLVTVRERTKEFGLRRAVGATPGDIVAMVLKEAVVLTAVAGYAGIVVGVAFLELVDAVIGDGGEYFAHPAVDLRVAVVAGVLLVFFGALSGVLPAVRAAAIHPVVALRSE